MKGKILLSHDPLKAIMTIAKSVVIKDKDGINFVLIGERKSEPNVYERIERAKRIKLHYSNPQ